MKRTISRMLAVLFIISLVLSVSACGGNSGSDGPKMQAVDSGNGFKVSLPADMKSDPTDGFELFYISDYAMMSVVREDYELLRQAGIDPDTLTIDDYAALVGQANGITYDKDASGNYVTEYTRNVDGSDFYYFTTLRQSSDSYWVVSFACFLSDRDKYKASFEEWAGTIETY